MKDRELIVGGSVRFFSPMSDGEGIEFSIETDSSTSVVVYHIIPEGGEAPPNAPTADSDDTHRVYLCQTQDLEAFVGFLKMASVYFEGLVKMEREREERERGSL
jgi:hypothetical protein